MKHFLFALFIGVLSVSFVADSAMAAKRFGGGSKIGKSFFTKKKAAPAAAPKPATPVNAAKSGAATKKKSGMGGLLGGLLAGGLLGALFFGGAFEDIQFMDILLIGLFAFVVYKIFAMMRKSSAAPKYAAAGGHNQHFEATPQPSKTDTRPQFGAAPSAAAAASNGYEQVQVPSWFNEKAFVEGACEHFKTLQRAWDASDWTEIETYTSSEVLAALKEERAKLAEQQNNEVVSVMAEMVGFQEIDSEAVVSLNFYGWMREDGAEQTTEFSEVWHLSRDMSAENAPWYIVGIEQA